MCVCVCVCVCVCLGHSKALVSNDLLEMKDECESMSPAEEHSTSVISPSLRYYYRLLFILIQFSFFF